MQTRSFALAGTLLAVAACGPSSEHAEPRPAPRVAGSVHVVRDSTIRAVFDAAGVAAPLRQATLSTKLMATVTEVLAQEGDAVTAGQPLVRLDARDLAAKASQAAASLAEAEAVHHDAEVQAARIRALYADSAAPKAHLDAAETGLARATAAVHVARAAAAELGAVSSYAVVRAPFAGVVTRRFVDPGAFAAPGAPLMTVQDASRLRITAAAGPDIVRRLHRGQPLDATIEGEPVRATVEGVVPAAGGTMYTVNAVVANPGRAILAGSAATLALPLGTRPALVIPAAAVRREGDLTGVTLRTPSGDETRWVRLGRAIGGSTAGGLVEVTAGLRAGDQLVVPDSSANAAVGVTALAGRD
jgi:RND family efflux transporter MFP subunit